MPQAAHTAVFSASDDDTTYSEIDGINDVSFGPSRDLLETTDFKDTSGTKTRISGLKDGTVQLSGDYEGSDAGQTLIRDAFDDGSTIYIKLLWNGTAGHKVTGLVESFDVKAAVDGKVEWSATIQFNGAAVTV